MDHRKKRCLLTLLVVLVLLGAGCGICFGTYYHASPEARALLAGSEDVQISAIRDGWFLDGPGTQDALVFYPGAKVEAAAYLPLLTALARDGVDCFLVKMPLNMAFFKMNAASDIQAAYTYDRWYLGGHSLGGACAALYAAKHAGRLTGLILLAAYATKPLPERLAVLELHGSEDGVLNRSRLEKGKQYLPASSVSAELPGDNHAQFGDYGPQKGDGAATISPEEQLAWTAARIEELILNR